MLAATSSLGLPTWSPLVIGLATHEKEIYVPGEPDPRRLYRHCYGLRLLQYVRDESHRFAQAYHHKLRDKALFE